MKNFFLVSFLVTSVFYSKAQTKEELQKFHTGTFSYKGMESEVQIIRTKKVQKEIFNKGKSRIIMKIEWLDDSTYVLTVKKIIDSPGCIKKGDKIFATIKSTNGNTYNCAYKSANCGSGETVFIKLE